MSAERIICNSEIYVFKWEIGQLLNGVLKKKKWFDGKVVVAESSDFCLDDDFNKWKLSLILSSHTVTDTWDGITEYQYGLGLRRAQSFSHEKKSMRIQCKILVDGIETQHDGKSISYEYQSTKQQSPIIMLKSNFHRSIVDQCSPTFTVTCYFHMKNNNSVFPIIDNPLARIAGKKLSIDFAEFFKSKKLTDTTFILGDDKIQAHKAILIARSPVFAAMFSQTMKEQSINEIHIEDIEYEVFEEMLEYIYTDDMSDLKCPVTKLLYTAEKYQLEDLKETCGALLEKGITIDNAAETYILANRYNLCGLSTRAQCFVREHSQDFLKSSGFHSMVDEYPELVKKIFQ